MPKEKIKTQLYQVRVEPDITEALNKIRKREGGATRASIVRKAIMELINRYDLEQNKATA